eukprot:TRINITY_DN11537_c2_g1_i9.p1 TRINITY_DN11537_c2_g1~~TRINITY_DN11537_c2_g1_i9.p1  ORF type:complete len:775 (+),score=154.17 TRINITY_DN11537_c2_g1_i9:331-2325(+)
MAATGNMSLVNAMATVMSDEARVLYNEAMKSVQTFARGAGVFYWSPTMNIGRDPRWGRFQESISEDPYLNGIYSINFVKGMQGDDERYLKLAATCKHFLAYSLEGYDNYTRHNFNAVVSDQDLQETYLPAFHACITQAHPAQVMCSYNEVNGVPTCAQADFLTKTLREDWGFKGFVVSDQGALTDIYENHHFSDSPEIAAAEAMNAGCDQNDGVFYAENLAGAIGQGLVREETINDALVRVLTQRFRVGAFDPPMQLPWTTLSTDILHNASHNALAMEAAQQAVVLLNNSAGVLPLDASKLKNVGVIGPAANNTDILTGGKTDYYPPFWVNHLAGIQNYLANVNDEAQVLFADGCPSIDCKDTSGFNAATEIASLADVTLVYLGIDHTVEHEGGDRKTIGLPENQVKLLQEVVKAAAGPVVAILVHGGPLMSDYIKENVATVVDAVDGGQSAGDALASVIFGDYTPSGMLPYTLFPEAFVHESDFTNMSMRTGPGRTYRFYKGQPLWPFGYSGSYTNFTVEWTGLEQGSIDIAQDSNVSMKARVTNNGQVAGSYVVQAYMQEVTSRDKLHPFDNDSAYAPNKSLFGIKKVHLEPGASIEVDFSQRVSGDGMQWCSFCTVSTSGKRGIAPGMYRIQIGGHGGWEAQAEVAYKTIQLHGKWKDMLL